VIPKLRNKAYLIAKAFHPAIQCKCISYEFDKAAFKPISNWHPIMGSKHYEGDSDPESTLKTINPVFDDFTPMYWPIFSFNIPPTFR